MNINAVNAEDHGVFTELGKWNVAQFKNSTVETIEVSRQRRPYFDDGVFEFDYVFTV